MSARIKMDLPLCAEVMDLESPIQLDPPKERQVRARAPFVYGWAMHQVFNAPSRRKNPVYVKKIGPHVSPFKPQILGKR